MTKFKKSIIAALAMVFGAAISAMAMTAPTANSFMYPVYDYAITKGVGGALGFVGGGFIIAVGIALAVQNKYMPAIATVICGAVLCGLPAVVTSMGATF